MNFFKHKLIFSAFIIIAIVVLSFLAFKIAYSQKIYPGVNIANIKVSGLSKKQAEDLLDKKAKEFDKREFVIEYKQKTVKATPEAIGFHANVEESILQAYELGHKSNPLADLRELFKSIGKKGELVPSYEIKSEELEKFLQNNFGDLETRAKNATLEYKGEDFILVKSKEGIKIDQTGLENQLKKNFGSLQVADTEIILVKDMPEIDDSETDTAYNQAHWIMDEEVTLYHKEKQWKVPGKQVLSWINFAPVMESSSNNNQVLGVEINRDKVKSYLETLNPEINQQPVNAQLTIGADGRVEVFALSQEGRELKIEESAEVITQSLNKGEKQVNLIIAVAKPEVTTDTIANLGITSLIAKGESNFKGSPKNRRLNIKVGAAKFNGVLIKPGEEFSFNTILGEVGPEQGYLPELVIKKGKTVPEYGGGLCQVSTTIFRAALNAGTPITERKNHAYVVRYYGTPGMDATIYPPHPDLRFKNDTPAHILIQSKIKGDEITFEFYGSNDGREVKLIGPNLYDAQPDGSVKAVLYREIYKNGELAKKDTFRSSYSSPANYPKVPFE